MNEGNQKSVESGAVRFYGSVPIRADSSVPVYEDRLDRDLRWALSEGGRHFQEDNAVFRAMRNITGRLKALGIPYAVVGGMALFKHGFRRFTEDVDILVTKAAVDAADSIGVSIGETDKLSQTMMATGSKKRQRRTNRSLASSFPVQTHQLICSPW